MPSKSGWPAVVARGPDLEPRCLPDCPVSLAHPFDARAGRVFVAAANVAFDYLGQLVAKIVGQRVSAVCEIVQGAVARREGHVEASEAGTLTTQHALKIGAAGRESSPSQLRRQGLT